MNVKLDGGLVKIWCRSHAGFLKNPDGSIPENAKYNNNPVLRNQAIAMGKPLSATDKANKEWMHVIAMPM